MTLITHMVRLASLLFGITKSVTALVLFTALLAVWSLGLITRTTLRSFNIPER